MSNDELIAVMVPRKHLAKVYGFVSTLDDEQLKSPIGNALNGKPTHSIDDVWTPSQMQRMFKECPPAMLDILARLSNAPNEWISTLELAKAIKNNPTANWKTVAGTLGAFGRRLKSRYEITTWPFEWKYDHQVGGNVYMMSESMANQIRLLM